MSATKTDGLRLVRMIQSEIKSLESEGWRKVGEVHMGGYYLVHLYHRGNKSSMMMRVYRNFCVMEKNKKVVKVIK